MEFKVRISELDILIKSKDSFMYEFCKDYLSDSDNTDISVFSTDEEIKKELSLVQNTTKENGEAISIYRKIARKLPDFSRVVFHGAAITYNEKAFLFTAPSGTGKTTHITLWKKFLKKKVGIVNGDKPILKIDDDVTVYGTPWAGKEKYQKNKKAKLYGICIITRGDDNTVRRLETKESLDYLMRQIYLPDVPSALVKTLKLIKLLIEKVPIYIASIDISKDAVKATFEALTNEKYGE